MNKNKKIAMAVVSTVMAGTMVVSLAACGPTDDGGSGATRSTQEVLNQLMRHMNVEYGGVRRSDANAVGWETAKSYWNDYLSGLTSSSGPLPDIDYENDYARSTEVTLNLAIGHNNTVTSTTVGDIGTDIKLPDNNPYSKDNLKPAWKKLAEELNVKFVDKYSGWATNANFTNIMADQSAEKSYANIDLFTSDLSYVAEYEAQNAGTVLNLAEYLNDMPHFKKFLNDNPIVYLSLLGYGMNASTGAGQTLYVAPYFDGNDAIERYCIIRKDWADKLLNGAYDAALSEAGSTYASACASKTSVNSYMGTVGYYDIATTSSDGTSVRTVRKDYSKALAAVKDDTTNLYKAYRAISGTNPYYGVSGNIVDIMNEALAANSGATGQQLLNLYRAYIDTCYVDVSSGNAVYTAENRSNVFNGVDACWDVDDLVAMLRIVKTNAHVLVGDGKTLDGIVPRSGQNDRTPDMVRLAAQLYGVRGADSRYEYTYIDADGTLKDARNDIEFYEAMNNFHNLREEGLIADYSDASTYSAARAKTSSSEAFMMYDYSQTQTADGFNKEATDPYNLAPIVTPVSKWDLDGNDANGHEAIMRFTESWRSTKTSGLAVNAAVANDANKLQAALDLVDYLYSDDGQILMTYGPKADNADGANGFWYNEPAADQANPGTNTFKYKGTYYTTNSVYSGKYTPTITEALYKSFLGEEVNGWSLAKSSNSTLKSSQGNYTNYARMLLGTTLPVGVKDQSFENQLTSACGKNGAAIVETCLDNETIKGMTLTMPASGGTYWYTCVPTGLPIESTVTRDILNASSQNHYRHITGTQMSGGNKNFISIFNYIILYGLSGTYNQQNQTYTF